MPAPEYPEAVLEYVQAQGWTTNLTELREGAYIAAGTRETDAGSEKMLLMIVCKPEPEVTTEHVEYLLKAGREKNADSVLLTHTVGISEKAQEIGKEYGVGVIDSENVRSHAEASDFGVDTDEISIPASDSESQTESTDEFENEEMNTGDILSAMMSVIFTIGWILLILFTIIGFLTPFSPPVFDVSDDIQGFLSNGGSDNLDSPEDVTEAYFEAVAEGDYEEAASYATDEATSNYSQEQFDALASNDPEIEEMGATREMGERKIVFVTVSEETSIGRNSEIMRVYFEEQNDDWYISQICYDSGTCQSGLGVKPYVD